MSIIPTNFQDILNIDSTELQRPPKLPPGTYLMLVRDPPQFGNSSQKGTPFVKFILSPIQPYEDVDEGDLKEAGGLEKRAFPLTFYITEAANIRLKEFMLDCGIEEGNFQEMIPQVQGSEVLGVVRHKPSRNPDEAANGVMYAEVVRTARVPQQ
jgi:hypothetical protein